MTSMFDRNFRRTVQLGGTRACSKHVFYNVRNEHSSEGVHFILLERVHVAPTCVLLPDPDPGGARQRTRRHPTVKTQVGPRKYPPSPLIRTNPLTANRQTFKPIADDQTGREELGRIDNDTRATMTKANCVRWDVKTPFRLSTV